MEYFKHLFRRYEGEVALAWSEWEWVRGPLPRDEALWHHQYARNAQQRRALNASLAAVGAGRPLEKFTDDTDLVQFGNTMILAIRGEDVEGHWQRYGGAITLGHLFYQFGERYTAQELFFWYYHAQKLVKKRDHPWGSEEVQEASQLRMKTWGHYGHRK